MKINWWLIGTSALIVGGVTFFVLRSNKKKQDAIDEAELKQAESDQALKDAIAQANANKAKLEAERKKMAESEKALAETKKVADEALKIKANGAVGVINTTPTVIRTYPTWNSGFVTSVPKGSTVNIVGEDATKTFWKIKAALASSNSYINGWVAKAFIDVVK